MGGASSQSLLCYGVSALHNVILTRAKERLWLAPTTLAHEYCATSTRPLTMFCKIFTAPKTFLDVVTYKTRNMGQSPTWGRPAPQVRLQRQFWVVQMPLAAKPHGESKWKVVWNRAEIPLEWVSMRAYNFFCLWTKVHQLFFGQRGTGCSWSTTFPFSIMWICSGNIRDQTRKLSEIALNFRRFLPSQILGGMPSPKIVPTWTPLPRGTSRGKVSWRYSDLPQSYRHAHPEF